MDARPGHVVCWDPRLPKVMLPCWKHLNNANECKCSLASLSQKKTPIKQPWLGAQARLWSLFSMDVIEAPSQNGGVRLGSPLEGVPQKRPF